MEWDQWQTGDDVAVVGVGAGLTWGSTLVRFGDQLFQIRRRAVIRIDAIIILHRVGAAQCPLAFFFPARMDGHQPKDIDPEFVQVIQSRGDALEIAGCGPGFSCEGKLV